jgi:hypothetical protein
VLAVAILVAMMVVVYIQTLYMQLVSYDNCIYYCYDDDDDDDDAYYYYYYYPFTISVVQSAFMPVCEQASQSRFCIRCCAVFGFVYFCDLLLL